VQLALARSLEAREPEQAASAYQTIIEHHPKCGEALHRLAILHDKAGRYDQSGPLFQKALKLQPRNVELLCDLGYSRYLQRRWAESEDSLRQAMTVQPQFKRAHNHLGMLLVCTDRREEAMQEFTRAGCTSAQSHFNCAIALLGNGQPDEAREEYEIALKSGTFTGESQARVAQLGKLIPQRADDASSSPPIQLTVAERTPNTAPVPKRIYSRR